MRQVSGLLNGCAIALVASGCSLFTNWSDINDTTGSSAGSNGTGTSAGSSGANTRNSSAGTKSVDGTSMGGSAASSSNGSSLGGNGAGAAAGIGNAAGAGNGTGTSGGANNTDLTGFAGANNYAGASVAGASSGNGTAGGATGGGSNAANPLGGATAGGAAASNSTLNGTAGVGTPLGGSASGGGAGTTATSPLNIASPAIAAGRTYDPYSASITASGASSYAWSLTAGTLPAGIALQSTSSATVQLTGTPTEAGLYPVTLSVSDGTTTKTVDVQLEVGHRVAFLSDRITSGVNELFMTEVGTSTPPAAVRLNAPISSGTGISKFTWSPDGKKVAYVVGTQLYVAWLDSPATATQISSDVSEYVWLSDGLTLAIAVGGTALFLADTSGSSPGALQKADVGTVQYVGAKRTVKLLTPFPAGRRIAFSVFDGDPAGEGLPSGLYVYLVDWPQGGEVASTMLSGSLNYPFSLSHDGRFVAVGTFMTDGLQVFDITNPQSPTGQQLYSPPNEAFFAWNTNSASMIATVTQASSATEIHLRTPLSGTWQDVLLASRNCSGVKLGPWSPDGSHVLFTCSSELRGIANVFSSAYNSDFPVLPSNIPANAFADIGWSPDARWVAVRSTDDTLKKYNLYIVQWAVPENATKPYTSSATSGVSAMQFAPNSSAIAYVGILDGGTVPALYLSALPASGFPSNAGALTSTVSPAVQNDITWLPGSRAILYRANDAGGAQLHAIAMAPNGTSATPMSISGASGNGIGSYQIAPEQK